MKSVLKTRQSGFTVIELILSLVILGIIAAMGALGFTDAVRGYLFGVDNANIAGKAQAALDRMTLELTHIDFWNDSTSKRQDGVTDSKSSSITFAVDFGDDRASDASVTLAYNDSQGTVTLNTGSNDRILVDDVTDFELAYYDNPSDTTGKSTYTSGDTMCIGITLELTGANGRAVTFTTRVVPMFNLPYAAPTS